MPTALITGANRGIGLEFVRQYAADGWHVHACCRTPGKARDLTSITGDVAVHRLDVGSADQIAALKTALGREPIDVLVNNAGVLGPEQAISRIDQEEWGSRCTGSTRSRRCASPTRSPAIWRGATRA
jgi:NAD(P)-dependent dehydrogenase (short-subunit alcohol dehydrogenase family)